MGHSNKAIGAGARKASTLYPPFWNSTAKRGRQKAVREYQDFCWDDSDGGAERSVENERSLLPYDVVHAAMPVILVPSRTVGVTKAQERAIIRVLEK
jgi:hypothetical protein